jgi:hypothetical protein
MSRDHFRFKGNIPGLQNLGGGHHGFPIGFGTHDQPDLYGCRHRFVIPKSVYDGMFV